jgi:hypothetical protein
VKGLPILSRERWAAAHFYLSRLVGIAISNSGKLRGSLAVRHAHGSRHVVDGEIVMALMTLIVLG